MFGSGMTVSTLHDCLAAVEPVELQGMRLLRACPPTGLFPTGVPREVLKDAVVELVQYTERCNTTTRRLHNLSAIRLTTITCLEYGL